MAEISVLEYASRMDILRSKMEQQGLSAFVVTELASIRYLCRYGGQGAVVRMSEAGQNEAALVVMDNMSVLLAGRLHLRHEKETAVGVEILEKGRSVYETAAKIVSGCKRVGFEDGQVVVNKFLHEMRKNTSAKWVSASGLVSGVRQVKSPDELANIRNAAACAEKAFADLLPHMLSGKRVTERNAAALLDYRMRMLGADDSSFPTRVLYGNHSGTPHMLPDGRWRKSGEPAMFDWGAVTGGYHSDMSRVVFFGDEDVEWRRAHDAVSKAIQDLEGEAVPGRKCSDFYREAEAAVLVGLKSNDWEFTSSAGHGIGIEEHEAPHISRWSEDEFRVGQVVCFEPSAYCYDKGCIHIEDMYIVSEGGLVRMTGIPPVG